MIMVNLMKNQKAGNNLLDRKRIYLGMLLVLSVAVIVIAINSRQKESSPEMIVYKSPTCGCCKKWITHLENNGFSVKSYDQKNMNTVKKTEGVSRQYQSCHTAIIDGYYIEGHVPAADIKKLLKEKPDAKGPAVPGMPVGSPGMEGNRQDRYSVLLVDKNDRATVYNNY